MTATLLIGALAVGGTLFAQQDEPMPVVTTPRVEMEITPENVQERLKQVEAAQDLEESVKIKAVELYKQAEEQLRQAAEHAKRAEEHRTTREQAPTLVENLKKELAEPAAEPKPDVPPEATIVQLEQLQAEAAKKLADAEKELAVLKAEPKTRADRRSAVPKRLEEIRKEIAELEKTLAAKPLPTDPPAQVLANRTFLQARKLNLEKEMMRLQEEIPRYDAMVELLSLKTDKQAREVARLKKLAEMWQGIVENRRRAEAQRQAAEARRAAANAHPAVQSLADENKRLAEQRTGPEGVTAKIGTVTTAIEEARARLKRLEENRTDIEEKLETEGMASVIGPLLLEQRAALPRTSDLYRSIRARQKSITEVKLQQSRLNAEDLTPAEAEAKVEEIVAGLDRSVPEAEREEIAAMAQNLLETRRELVDSLRADYESYFNRLIDLGSEERRLIDRTEAYSRLLDENLLWVSSTDVIRPADLPAIVRGLEPLVSIPDWQRVLADLVESSFATPLATVLVCIAFAAMLLWRTQLRRKLAAAGEAAGRSYTAAYSHTIRAFLLTAAISLVWPVLMYFLGWRLTSYLDAAEFSRAVGAGLMATAVLYATLESIRQICRPQGLAESHFHWPRRRIRLFRRHLRWLKPAALPLLFIIAMLEWQGDPAAWNSLGRLVLIVELLLAAFFLQRVLRPVRVEAEAAAETAPRLSENWGYRISVALPLLIAAAAVLGYHHTAWELCLRLLATVWLMLGVVVFQAMIVRWFYYSRGQIALEQARLRREAQQAADGNGSGTPTGQGGEAGGEAAAAPAEVEIDLGMVNLHTRQLLRVCVATAVLTGIWTIWLDVLPGFGFLEYELWSTTSTVTRINDGADGVSVPEDVTVATAVTVEDAVLAVLVVIVAFIVAKNLPGLLEVLLLQYLPLDSGARYAATTLIRYILVTAGIVAAFLMIGVGWSKVQWLVAGLSVGLGFGLQELFANFVSGLILLFERPIRVGDTVTIGDVTGTAIRIQIRATTLLDWERKELIVPNKELITGRLLNWTLSNSVNRVSIHVGIAYGSDTRLAREILQRILREHPGVLDDPAPFVTFEKFGDNSLGFVLRVYLPDLEHRLETVHDIHTAIDNEFRKAGIEIAFPQRDIHIRSVTTNGSPADSASEVIRSLGGS